MTFTEYVLVALAVFCFLASFVLFMLSKSEQGLPHQMVDGRLDQGAEQAVAPDRFGFRRMGHCLPWW